MSTSATAYTYEFVRAALPWHAARILEIGCGDGALAARLQTDGLSVVALDSDEGCVASARARGVDARLADWPDFSDGVFDAVLFTRSFHHMDDLEESAQAACDCLRESGRILVEDFDFAFDDEKTFAWFGGMVKLLAAAGMTFDPSSFVSGLLVPGRPPLEVWRAEHGHRLHSAEEIEDALDATAFQIVMSPAAYFFRYVAAAARNAEPLVEELRRHELSLIEREMIEPLGRRYAADV